MNSSMKYLACLFTLSTLTSSCTSTHPDSEEQITFEQLPAAVQAAVKKHVKGEIEEIEREIDDGVLVYEVEAEEGDNEVEYTFSPSGKLLEKEIDDDDDDEDDDHEDDDHEDDDHDDDDHDDDDDHEDDDDHDDEEEISFEQLPTAVQAAIKTHVKGEIEEIEKETENGVVIYEVEAEQDGQEIEYKFSATGKLISKELED